MLIDPITYPYNAMDYKWVNVLGFIIFTVISTVFPYIKMRRCITSLMWVFYHNNWYNISIYLYELTQIRSLKHALWNT